MCPALPPADPFRTRSMLGGKLRDTVACEGALPKALYACAESWFYRRSSTETIAWFVFRCGMRRAGTSTWTMRNPPSEVVSLGNYRPAASLEDEDV
jgi:hypothetical protein